MPNTIREKNCLRGAGTARHSSCSRSGFDPEGPRVLGPEVPDHPGLFFCPTLPPPGPVLKTWPPLPPDRTPRSASREGARRPGARGLAATSRGPQGPRPRARARSRHDCKEKGGMGEEDGRGGWMRRGEQEGGREEEKEESASDMFGPASSPAMRRKMGSVARSVEEGGARRGRRAVVCALARSSSRLSPWHWH